MHLFFVFIILANLRPFFTYFSTYIVLFHIFRCSDEDGMNVHTEASEIDFEQPIYLGEVESKKDPTENLVSLDLLKLVE